MLGWVTLLGFVLAAVAIFAYRFLYGRSKHGYLAHTEYWVFVPEGKVPPMPRIMDRMIKKNPHNTPDGVCITQREGMIFSDIRLNISVAKREKNPHAFRPDLFEETVVPTKEILEALSDSSALVKVRYTSKAALPDTRHLIFLPHLADAIADLCKGKVVFDTVAQRLFLAEEFSSLLDAPADRPDLHVNLVWKSDGDESYAQSQGLRKVGQDEIKTDSAKADQEVLIRGLATRASHKILREMRTPESMELSDFGDTFLLSFRTGKDALTHVSILRRRGD